jgi:hypothetical protein
MGSRVSPSSVDIWIKAILIQQYLKKNLTQMWLGYLGWAHIAYLVEWETLVGVRIYLSFSTFCVTHLIRLRDSMDW